MKKLVLLMCLICVATMLKAQSTTFKPFKVDLGLGYGFGKAKGIIAYLEPKYNVMDELAVGIRWESALLGNVDVSANTGSDPNAYASVDVSAIGSYLVTGDYYFSNATFRPLAGFGAGVYTMGSIRQSAGVGTDGASVSQDINVGTKFGVAPRVGFEAGHFRMGLEYNIITGQPKDFNRNYFSAKIGAVIGGGRR